MDGARYLMTVIDDYTRKTSVYFLKSKNVVKSTLPESRVLAENQTDKKLKIIPSDNGKEYINRELNNFLNENGLRH